MLFLSGSVFAQKNMVREANRELSAFEAAKTANKITEQTTALSKAKTAIDAASQDASTSGDYKTWLIKAQVYLNMQSTETLANGSPYLEGAAALNKALELNPKLENDNDYINLSYQSAVHYFNSGVNFYNDSKFQESYESLNQVMHFIGREENKKFKKYPVDTIRAQSQMLEAYDAYYLDKNDEAISLLKNVVKSPYLENTAGAYLLLVQAYEKKKDSKNQLAILEEALKKYPSDQNLKNAHLNYLIQSGDFKTLEEQANADPNNVELAFNMGILYQELGMPKDGKAPKDSEANLAKAEKYYKKVIETESNNGIYSYQLGAFYFNQAVNLAKYMNDLPISEQAKYEKAKKEAEGFYEKALPYLEKARSIFNRDKRNLTNDEKRFQFQTLQALSELYARQNKLEKSEEVKKEMKEVNQ